MKNQALLIFKDYGAREAIVLEAAGDNADTLFNMDAWDSDLGVFDRNITHGLWIWEGDLDEDGNGTGEFRRLTAEELRKVNSGERVLDER